MSTAPPQPLTAEEVDCFVDSLDTNDGCVTFAELESKLDDVYEKLRPHHAIAKDAEKDDEERAQIQQRHDFIRNMMQSDDDTTPTGIPIKRFKEIVRSWEVPSVEQEKRAESNEAHYLDNVNLRRRIRAWWSVVGPEAVFLLMVVALQLGLGIWQCLKYALGSEFQAAFGWGVALAKFSAGSLYATLFFLLLSMSRWWSTSMRQFYYVSRFINWDHAQVFHIIMSIEALVFATLHAIGHLAGTFNFGSRPDRQPAVGALLGEDVIPRSYVDYVRSLPGASGLTALGILYLISLMSMPVVRRRSYEAFQCAHLLMFPFIGLLMCHGARRLLQFPVLGLVLAVPTALIIAERSLRLLRSFLSIDATVEVLDKDTVCVSCDIPSWRIWSYRAGQYAFLQVPQLSRWQWHPFTISLCMDREMQLHIKTDGNWTGALRKLAESSEKGKISIKIGIDGPFGAPAQRFYDFDQTIIVGAGIGITPFSAILHDLQVREDHRWSTSHAVKRRRSSSFGRQSHQTSAIMQARARLAEQRREGATGEAAATTASPATLSPVQSRGRTQSRHELNDKTLSRHPSILPNNQRIDLALYRRVDMHWIVRDKNDLLWFSDLLNDISTEKHNREHLDVRIANHVTRKHDDISVHVFRWLLERHRTDAASRSPLTGLVAPTQFGRPDFPAILNTHYDEMRALFTSQPDRRRRVGVFFCGAPVIGAQLADLCNELMLRGAQDGTQIEYHFQMEVFN